MSALRQHGFYFPTSFFRLVSLIRPAYRVGLVCTLCCFWGTSNGVIAQTPQLTGTVPASSRETPGEKPLANPANPAVPTTPAATPAPVSEAERISGLQRSIDADAARVKELERDLSNPKSPYALAETEFKKLDMQLNDLRKELKQAENDNNVTRQQEITAKIQELEPTWEESKRRFELEIESSKTRKATLETLNARLKANRELLEKLRNPDVPASKDPNATMPAPATATPPTGTAPGNTPTPAANPATTPPPLTPTEVITGVPSTTPAAPSSPLLAPPAKDEQVQAAEAKVEQLTQESAKAQAELDSVTQRINSLEENIGLERKLRDLARQKVIEAEAEVKKQRQSYWQQLSAGDLTAAETRKQLDESQKRLDAAAEDSRKAANHLDELQSELALVQAEQIAAMRLAEKRSKDVEDAKSQLDSLSSPWSRHRIERWLVNQGVRILIILIVGLLVLRISRALRKRLVDLIVNRSRRGTTNERENRARTLVSVFHNAFTTFVYGLMAVLVLEEFGFSVTPLLGGAAVVGLAVAFGAQSLIKDYFTGFIVLLEQQYMLGDVIKIGSLSGQVERVTLRMTVLRDLEGNVHFIPHGQINFVTNMTHGWSRAVFDVQISYDADIDQTIRVIMDLGRELRRDPAFGPLIIEELSMLGVDNLGDSGIVIKFFIATRPLQQWTIKREMLRRIKMRFDQDGIEIPYPQMTLHTSNGEMPEQKPRHENPLLS
ncbi:mechanosensitive ion channel [bacterium]|nr:mechanosensitive ion channel [bacterium]